MSKSLSALSDISERGTYLQPGSNADGTLLRLLSDIKIVQNLPRDVDGTKSKGF